MDRVKGYYWVQICYYLGWHVAYWDGIEWRFNGDYILDRHMEKITETPIPEPEEKEIRMGKQVIIATAKCPKCKKTKKYSSDKPPITTPYCPNGCLMPMFIISVQIKTLKK